GRVFDGVENERSSNWSNGERSIQLAIQKQPGANTVKVVDAIMAVLPQLQEQIPPAINLRVRYDRSIPIRESVRDVKFTLMLALVLVILVIFMFLRNLSATAIPSMALPMSIVGTFSVMYLLGFSVDNLSLMALTLSVGFVVDDAIVMLENIVRHMEMGKKPYRAAIDGAREIGFTILSMTISLAAVFIPIIFMSGIVGRLLHEFAVVIVIAVLASGVVSITLTPMLCARFLRDEHGLKQNAFHRASERAFLWMHGFYERTLRWSLEHKPVIVGMFIASVVATYAMFVIMPQDFLPADDTGVVQIQVQAANGTSFERMVAYGKQVADIVNADPNTKGAMFQVQSSGAGSNGAQVRAMLKPHKDRKMSAEQIARDLRRQVSGT